MPPSADRSRIDSRLLPSPMYEPSGERWSHNPLSFGPRCRCTAVMRASVSRFPQFARPLMPHIGVLDCGAVTRTDGRSSPRADTGFVHFRFNLKKLDALKPAIDQPRHAVKKSKTQYVFVKHE